MYCDKDTRDSNARETHVRVTVYFWAGGKGEGDGVTEALTFSVRCLLDLSLQLATVRSKGFRFAFTDLSLTSLISQ